MFDDEHNLMVASAHLKLKYKCFHTFMLAPTLYSH
jgi:hypothetical protein